MGTDLIHTSVTCCEFKSLLNLQRRGPAEGKRGQLAFRPKCLLLMGEKSHSREAEWDKRQDYFIVQCSCDSDQLKPYKQRNQYLDTKKIHT